MITTNTLLEGLNCLLESANHRLGNFRWLKDDDHLQIIRDEIKTLKSCINILNIEGGHLKFPETHDEQFVLTSRDVYRIKKTGLNMCKNDGGILNLSYETEVH